MRDGRDFVLASVVVANPLIGHRDPRVDLHAVDEWILLPEEVLEGRPVGEREVWSVRVAVGSRSSLSKCRASGTGKQSARLGVQLVVVKGRIDDAAQEPGDPAPFSHVIRQPFDGVRRAAADMLSK